MEREQIVVAAKLSVAAGLKRALPIWWEFTWIGGLLRAGQRRDCSWPALEVEGTALARADDLGVFGCVVELVPHSSWDPAGHAAWRAGARAFSPTTVSGHSLPTRSRQTHIKSFDEKGDAPFNSTVCFHLLSRTCDANVTP